ncbi:RNA polymerase sigma factor [Hydrogenophaga sp. MI9]|uniref:RNA polymerase sigma factor n=1 Tax=Hydrogenophaga sp. MI9 TaxID=3453719 RepID=UPI003EE9379E
MSPPPAATGLGATLNSFGRWVGKTLAPPSVTIPRDAGWTLWQAACSGDEGSATALVRQLTPQAMGLARQLLPRQEDAEDMVQEAFLRLWSARPDEARGAALATYFNTIVINRCKTWLTRRRELSTDPEELTGWADAQMPDQGMGDPAGPALDALHLQAAMHRLPPRQRMALAMWAYADADAAEIARALDLDTNAAHQLLHRARQALRRCFQENPP